MTCIYFDQRDNCKIIIMQIQVINLSKKFPEYSNIFFKFVEEKKGTLKIIMGDVISDVSFKNDNFIVNTIKTGTEITNTLTCTRDIFTRWFLSINDKITSIKHSP